MMRTTSQSSWLLAKIAAAQNEVALRYLRVRGLYLQANIFAVTIVVVAACFPKTSLRGKTFILSNIYYRIL